MNEPTQNLAVNPFLPLSVYIPDGEPHVFGDRVYLFGSHDAEGGDSFCLLDYEFYSAPVNDLSNWTSRGSNYSAKQDPLFDPEQRCSLYAPDVVRGNDGRYYLYYCLSGPKGKGGYSNPISVAVSDEPDGKYEYLGFVRTADGKPYLRYICFDPAVINDEGTIRLYFGTQYPFDAWQSPLGKRFAAQIEGPMFGRSVKELQTAPDGVTGAITVTLQDDMLTVAEEGKRILPLAVKKSDFVGHAFFEGSSIRKIGERYYFIYSSILNHELCYATSSYPDRDFRYGGTILSTGDIGLDKRKAKDRLNHTGTTHGSIEQINGQWYVFYHRLTHGSGYSRQACAEKISILPDGRIPQVRVTSCGLNASALPAAGSYSAAIACVLTDGHMEHTGNGFLKKPHPQITHRGNERFITGIRENTRIGFRSFAFDGPATLTLTCRGTANGRFAVSTVLDGAELASFPVNASADWQTQRMRLSFPSGDADLYLRFYGKGEAELLNLGFE